jgi:large repetitive protein
MTGGTSVHWNVNDLFRQLIRRHLGLARAAQAALAVVLALVIAGPAASAVSRAAPVASFTFSPSDPVQGEPVRFTSTSTDPDNDIDRTRWDLDNDGSFDDGSSTTVTRSYTCSSATSSCSQTVRLRVEDEDENVRTASRTFTVTPNSPPVAAFSANPESPETSEQFTLTSTSSDPDGRPVVERWDTNNNGSYTDATGRQITLSFPDNGVRRIGLQVTDSGGLVRTTFLDITIRNRKPVASFNVSATEIDTGESIQFTSTSTDPDGTVSQREWDFNGDGVTDATGNSVSRTFADNGTPTITLKVTDNDGDSSTASRQVTVRNRPPVAGFNLSAGEVDTGEPVQFTSTSSDPDGTVSSTEWDFDGDGATDATGSSVSHSFSDDRTWTVTLKVTDDDGASRSTSREVTARNRPPRASFDWSPDEPVTGEEVVFTSTSNDPDDEIEEYEWDLDGDGDFNDGDGPEARRSFGEPGTYTVGLRVRDDNGRTSAAFETIEVAPRPAPPPQNPSGPAPAPGTGTDNALGGLISPFPSVRIRGVTTVTGARIDLLSVRTPGGTRVLVRCKGRDCPWRRRLLRARFGANVVRVLRVPGFKRRRVRAGTVIEVFVIARGRIGKYTRFRIRRLNMGPIRVDRCTARGVARVRRCPT